VLLRSAAGAGDGTLSQSVFTKTMNELMHAADVETALVVSAHDEINDFQSVADAAARAGGPRLYRATQQGIELWIEPSDASNRRGAVSRRNGRPLHVRESEIASHVAELKSTASIHRFDVVIVGAHGIEVESTPPALLGEARTTRVVVIDSLESPYGYALLDGLLASGAFHLLDSGMTSHGTYAVLRRLEP
jgi:hypothetical protein